MNTKLFEPDEAGLACAARLVRNGGTVVFPTETVYGLGANALLPWAVKKIFEAKGRPQDNPLIVHISKAEQLYDFAEQVPPVARTLAKRFWPGPLTMILKRNAKIPDIVTAGLPTVGFRLPSDTAARRFLEIANVPIAAPSANLSGKPSPTCFEHVRHDLLGRVDGIIRGEPSVVGLESTIIKVDGETPVLLRPGGITLEQLQSVCGTVAIGKGVFESLKGNEIAAAPGMKYKHYAPQGQVVVVQGSAEQVLKYINQQLKLAGDKKTGVLAYDDIIGRTEPCTLCLSLGDRRHQEQGASRLFSHLRAFDDAGIELIYAQGNDINGIGLALSNRLNKSAGFHIIKLEDK